MSENLGESTLVMVEQLLRFVVDSANIYDNVTGAKDGGIATAFKVYKSIRQEHSRV